MKEEKENKDTQKESKQGKHVQRWYLFRPISSKLDMMIEPLNFICYISLCELDVYSRSQLYKKSKTYVNIFLEISWPIWIRFSVLRESVRLLKLMLNLVRTNNIQGREF